MKKLLYTCIALIGLWFTACEVEEGVSKYPQALQGKIAFDLVEGRIYQQLSLLELMAAADYYLLAPEDKKEDIKNYYFRDYELTQKEDQLVLINEVLRMVFVHHGQTLNEPGAIWAVEVATKNKVKENYILNKEHFSVKCLANKEWNLVAISMPFIYLDIRSGNVLNYEGDETITSSFQVKGTPLFEKETRFYDYTIARAEGNVKGYPILQFELLEPMFYSGKSTDNFFPSSGKLKIKADNDLIEATLKTVDTYTKLHILFKGKTEEWAY